MEDFCVRTLLEIFGTTEDHKGGHFVLILCFKITMFGDNVADLIWNSMRQNVVFENRIFEHAQHVVLYMRVCMHCEDARIRTE
jgi:hypothetical protein